MPSHQPSESGSTRQPDLPKVTPLGISRALCDSKFNTLSTRQVLSWGLISIFGTWQGRLFPQQEQNETFILSGRRTQVFGSPDSHDPGGCDKAVLPTSRRRPPGGLSFPPWGRGRQGQVIGKHFLMKPSAGQLVSDFISGRNSALSGVLVSRNGAESSSSSCRRASLGAVGTNLRNPERQAAFQTPTASAGKPGKMEKGA